MKREVAFEQGGHLCSDAAGSSRDEMEHRVALLASYALRRINETGAEHIHARYDLGRLIHLLRSGQTDVPTKGILRDVAAFLHLDVSAVRRMARVTEGVSSSDLAEWLTMSQQTGFQLTWSHLEVLAGVRPRSARRVIARTLITDRMSVRELRARARASARGLA